MDQNIPILVVNLTRSKERRVYMQEQLDAFGVRYEFYPAVDGNALTPQQRACYSEEKSVRHTKRSLTNGEIGCALSHLQIYEKMVAEDIAELLILEDDAVIKKDFFSIIFQRAQWVPANWKMLHFSTEDIRLNTFPCYFIDTQKRYRLYRYIDTFFLTHCYLVTQKCAKWLIKMGYPIHLTADDLIGRSHNSLHCYTIVPGLCDRGIDIFPSIIDKNLQRSDALNRLLTKKRGTYKHFRSFITRMFFLPISGYCTFAKKCQLFLRKIIRNVRILRFLYRQYVAIRDAVWFRCLQPFSAPSEPVQLNDEGHEVAPD